jgi:hypothetical protein
MARIKMPEASNVYRMNHADLRFDPIGVVFPRPEYLL